jgi:hypothetical protein
MSFLGGFYSSASSTISSLFTVKATSTSLNVLTSFRVGTDGGQDSVNFGNTDELWGFGTTTSTVTTSDGGLRVAPFVVNGYGHIQVLGAAQSTHAGHITLWGGDTGAGALDSLLTYRGKNGLGFRSQPDYSVLDSTASTTLFLTNGNKVGIGTTTPAQQLTISSSTGPQLGLADGSLASNHWTFRSQSGALYIATSSPTSLATSTVNALSLDKDGNAAFPLKLTTLNLLALGSSTLQTFNATTGLFGSKVGIGTTTPTAILTLATSTFAEASTPIAFLIGGLGLTSGSAGGTIIGTNLYSSFAGDYFNFQKAGVKQFGVDSFGNGTFNGDVTGANIVAGTLNHVHFTSSTRIAAPSDGVLELINNASNDFTRLQFGGTTSSFPSIKRSTTLLAFRLADDSADAGITAGTGLFNSSTTLQNFTSQSATSTNINFTGNLTAGANYINATTSVSLTISSTTASFIENRGFGAGTSTFPFGRFAESRIVRSVNCFATTTGGFLLRFRAGDTFSSTFFCDNNQRQVAINFSIPPDTQAYWVIGPASTTATGINPTAYINRVSP